MLREMIGYGFYFSFYEIMKRGMIMLMINKNKKKKNKKNKKKQETTTWMNFICGGVTGSCMWALYYPIDAIKSRQQAR